MEVDHSRSSSRDMAVLQTRRALSENESERSSPPRDCPIIKSQELKWSNAGVTGLAFVKFRTVASSSYAPELIMDTWK
jgi:hypothetical protein